MEFCRKRGDILVNPHPYRCVYEIKESTKSFALHRGSFEKKLLEWTATQFNFFSKRPRWGETLFVGSQSHIWYPQWWGRGFIRLVSNITFMTFGVANYTRGCLLYAGGRYPYSIQVKKEEKRKRGS